MSLAGDLASGKYMHGKYTNFLVEDNKRRLISVATIRDRVIHRLVYEYLVSLFDHTFDFGVWSCRNCKGLVGAVHYCNQLTQKYPNAYVWRADIRKFFDNVDSVKLFAIIKQRVSDPKALWIIQKILASYSPGISIGNLTSQIFANIYLNEFDRFVRHTLRPLGYLRYGDDFVVFANNKVQLEIIVSAATGFLNQKLSLELNRNNHFFGKARSGIMFLGCIIMPDEIMLNRRNKRRIFRRLNSKNISSYHGLLRQFGDKELQRRLAWQLLKYT